MSSLRLVLGVLLIASVARATPESEAKALNAQGKQLFQKRDYAGALELFRAAQTHSPDIKLLLNIGGALLELERYAEAADAYEKYVQDPAANPERKQQVLEILRDRLGAHVAKLQLDVNEPGARVLVDGKALGGSPQSVTIHVEVGTHTVVAEKEGYAMATATLTLRAGQERLVELHLTSSPTEAAPPAPAVPAATEQAPLATTVEPPPVVLPPAPPIIQPPPITIAHAAPVSAIGRSRRTWIVGLVIGAVAAAALGVGLGVGLGTGGPPSPSMGVTVVR